MGRSGLQRDILGLYRNFLRAARTKVGVPEQQQIAEVVRWRFREDAVKVKRTDFQTIEFMIRTGKKQLKLVQNPNVTNLGAFLPNMPNPLEGVSER